MKNQQAQVEEKLPMAMMHVPIGLAEIDRYGNIIFINEKGEALLKPILVVNDLKGNNLFSILEHIAPAVINKIKTFPDDSGSILKSDPYSFSFCFGGETLERHFDFMATKILADSIIVGFDDITEEYGKEKAMLQLASERAVVQGKYEIASNVLHDIGNAVVGFGSYITRIKRSLEANNIENLQKLSGFFASQQTILTTLLGEAKAGAAIKMLNSISDVQKTSKEEISKSIAEQLNIINHIQEILSIQRQYLNGQVSLDKKPTNLRTIISDCMSMVFASIEKRAIAVSVNVPETLPAINGDRTRLMQVILNLLKNSIEAIDINSDKKHISVSVKTKDDLLILEVQDSGTGFDKATGSMLFARGFTTKASGTGLGLDNCRSIIESHDGSINITSEGFGKGALATIEFKI
ncbi:MAG: HAMP domain-containing histidine kinase [Bacteroidia bacterium]|nr:HAMP domain-containing histidine kinase [Bacteroidia bacterium]